jgi:serine/threonine-protein kinase RsbT
MNITGRIAVIESSTTSNLGARTTDDGEAGRAAPPASATEARIRIQSSADIVAARQQGRTLGKLVGFSASDLTIIATAISEIARNIVEYANDGTINIALVNDGGRLGIRIVAKDSGPGIADVSTVMRDGYSTDCRLGIGLPGARRLMDEFRVVSVVGDGTTITMTKWL